MIHTSNRTRLAGIAAGLALASTTLTACSGMGNIGGKAHLDAGRAEAALAKGKARQAIPMAERAVMADPRNPAFRVTLGQAYLNAGRFHSAATSFDDAMALGDTNSRTALSLALAHIGAGQQQQALAVLDEWRDDVEPSDLGLAYALAGQANRGVYVLSAALRGGDNTPKTRQNLAYAYALAGDWAQARLMAAQDVPADQINDRILQWAQSSVPGAEAYRIATLLNVTVPDRDPGQPTALALANFPAQHAEAAAPQPPVAIAEPAPVATPRPAGELPALARYEAPVSATPQNFASQINIDTPSGPTPAAVIAETARFVSRPVVQSIPANYGVEAKPRTVASPAIAAKRSVSSGNYAVQLGSFSTEQSARQAWKVYAGRHAGLSGYKLKLTRAQVDGKRFWRVAATGFDRSGAQALCNRVARSGGGCIPYSNSNPLPGALD